MKKFLISCVLIIVCLAGVVGITFLVKGYEKDNDNYAGAIEDLRKQITVHVQNVTEMQKELELNGLTIDDLRQTVIEYQTKIEQQTKTITEYRDRIVEKEAEIVEKEKIVESKEKEIVEKEKTITEYEDRVVELEKNVETNQGEIESLQGQIAQLKSQVSSLSSELATARQKISELESENETLKNRISELEADNESKTRVITEKEYIIEEKEAENAQLNINIEILNQTIVELNVKINLLEEALNKDESKTYLNSLFNCEMSVYNGPQDYKIVRVSPARGGFRYGLYLLNILDFSINSLSSYSDSNFYVMDNSRIFIYDDIYGYKVFDVATKTFLNDDSSLRFSAVYKLPSENLLCFSHNNGFYYFNVSDFSCLYIDTDSDIGSRVFFPQTNSFVSAENGKIYISSGLDGGTYYFDEKELFISKVSDIGINLDDFCRNFLVSSFDKIYFCGNDFSLYCLDTNLNSISLIDSSVNWEFPIILKSRFIISNFSRGWDDNEDIRVFDTENEHLYIIEQLDKDKPIHIWLQAFTNSFNYSFNGYMNCFTYNMSSPSCFEEVDNNIYFVNDYYDYSCYLDLNTFSLYSDSYVNIRLRPITFDSYTSSWVDTSSLIDGSTFNSGLYFEKENEHTYITGKFLDISEEVKFYCDGLPSGNFRLLYLDENHKLKELPHRNNSVGIYTYYLDFDETLLKAVSTKDNGVRSFDILVCFDMNTPLYQGYIAFD